MAPSTTTMTATEKAPPHLAKKSVENTVFVRFEPSSNLLRRHHVEDVFSQIGPIKKCSVIHAATSSFGFVKFTAPEDAELAAVQLNRRKIKVEGQHHLTVTVHCELAKKQQQPQSHQPVHQPAQSHQSSQRKSNQQQPQSLDKDKHNENDNIPHDEETDPSQSKKKTNRLILRNLSFYAKEKDIRQVLEPLFGELLEVHIPSVNQNHAVAHPKRGGSSSVIATHRGFAFVTLASDKAVQKCMKRMQSTTSPPIVIKDRPVQIERSLHKTAHQAQQAKEKLTARQQQQQQQSSGKKNDHKEADDLRKRKDDDEEKGEEEREEAHSEDEMDNREEEEESSSTSESEGEDHDEESDDDDEDDGSTSKNESRQRLEKDETAVQEKRCLFLRNLPFDCTRHDIFETFRPFGFITAIYLVKDKETGKVPRGTAFVSFRKADQAAAALEAATTVASSFVSQRNTTVEEQWEHRQTTSSTLDSGGIVVKGRKLLVDLAVDKSTASTLTAGERKAGEGGESGKDRRNLYLKGEGRVENDEAAGNHAWDELPETDKLKRQTAWSEKNTKLRSPLFFINPNRLSFRNLAKHVTEPDLKQLCVNAIQRGLDLGLVTAEDQIALWRASGEMTTREILARIQEADDSKTSILPAFDPNHVKQFIPAVHVHRDYIPGANKQAAPSRGFGFVEFEHHAHALACLREVNNNPRYSAEFATGGKQAADMKRKRAGKKPRGVPADATGEDALANETLLDPSGKVRTPRLVVEFTVENKTKAKQQEAHKAHQQANQIKQLEERQQKRNVDKQQQQQQQDQQQTNSKANKAKKSRGAKQRERKRKLLEEGGAETESAKAAQAQSAQAAALEPKEKPKKPKGTKPPKKQKLDQAEEKFTKLVEEFKQDTVAPASSSSGEKAPAKTAGKRWFE